ncbi:MAG: phosphoribosylformylglycinamidine cyclo-ligase [Bacteroidota bacterium]
MLTYKDAGVDIEAGDRVVDQIKPLVRQTFTPGVLADVGAFGGFFAPDLSGYTEPVFVSSVDGVGTKLMVAVMANRHDTVGQDLVNHCVNDIAVCGAKPLFFLDYFSTGRLDPHVAVEVIRGFALACKENGCALIGGETAEMPDLYRDGDYDLAGTIVGIVDRPRVIDGGAVEAGDVLIGLPSTGLHTNGYSLARKALFAKYTVEDTPKELGGVTLADALLAVHRSYLKPIQALIEKDLAHAFSHITGGGIVGNTKRVVAAPLDLHINWSAWERPALFGLIQEAGHVPESDMRSAFNLGIGLIAVVPANRVPAAMDTLQTLGETPVVIGEVR